jgi:thiol-disulfide isomerase/thioredoxin/predicted negative regulator of RcsB-dependent stress response
MLPLLLLAALPFLEDDYATAVSRAKKLDQPVVVDLWATWCHSCLSMRHFVFTDPALDGLAKRAVFVAIDTDKDKNKQVVAALKPQAWPTFMALDPKDETLIAELVGSAVAPEFSAFVEQAVQALADKRAGKDTTLVTLTHADQEGTMGHAKEAIAGYEKALATALTPQARGRIAYSLVNALSAAHDEAKCRKVALAEAAKIPGTYFEAALYDSAIDCSDGGKALSTAERDSVRTHLQQAVAGTLYTTDDKSDLYGALAELAESAGDKAGATKLENDRLAMLEDAAAHAPNKAAARTFDAHRAELYIDLGRPDDAIKLLQQSEKDAPQDYNPPARLARAYFVKGDLAQAKVAIARAKKLVYGPRSAVIYLLDGDILAKAGDKPGAHAAYVQAQKILEVEAKSPGVTMRLKDLDKKLAALGT